MILVWLINQKHYRAMHNARSFEKQCLKYQRIIIIKNKIWEPKNMQVVSGFQLILHYVRISDHAGEDGNSVEE
jgi:hypothetical protein